MGLRRFRIAILVAIGVLGPVEGCGSGDGPSLVPAQDAATETPSTAGYPARHANFPRVQNLGGPVLKAPNVIPVFFGNDPFQSQIEQFLDALAGSSYWTAATSEYGVGSLQTAPSIVVSDAIPSSISDIEIRSWLAGYLDGTHPEWPVIDVGNVYLVFFPQTTTITSSGTPPDSSCQAFGGYHGEGRPKVNTSDAADSGEDGGDDGGDDARDGGVDGSSFVYGVIARCSTFNGLTGIDHLTAATSHELVEAATNPLPRTMPAFAIVDFDHLAWAYDGFKQIGTEVGDMCAGPEAHKGIYQPFVRDFMVQRTWSNQAAEANQDPCVPAIPEVYFNAAPDLDETLLVGIPPDRPALNVPTIGARIPVGQSQTINFRLFSTGPIADWYLLEAEYRAAGAPRTLQVAFDKASANNGDVISVKLTRAADGPLPGGNTEISIASSPTPVVSPGNYQHWNLFIGN